MGRIERLDDGCASVSPTFNFLRAVPAPSDCEAICDTVLGELAEVEADSFVTARRADKRFPLTSPQISGSRRPGWRVDLERPALTVRVEVLGDRAFCCLRKEPGAGGLPSGVSGRVACLRGASTRRWRPGG